MQILVLVLSLFGFTSFANAKEVTLKSTPANELLQLMKKAKALHEEPSCGMGKCYLEGQLRIVCKYPMSKADKQKSFCEVFDLIEARTSVELSDGKSKEMIKLINSVQSDSAAEADCSAGSCHLQGLLTVTCSYPTEGKGSKTACDISEVKRRQDPAAAQPEKKGKATR